MEYGSDSHHRSTLKLRLAEVCAMQWYKSKKGWVSTVLGFAYFILYRWGQFDSAKEIWHLVRPHLPAWSVVSQWIPLLFFGLAVIFFEIDRRSKSFIEILAPVNHAEVGLRRIVIGSVQSPSSIVQVLVFAVDKWHLQGSVAEVDGFAWKVDCHFGNEQSGLGKDFKIIAIADGNISGGPFLSLPTTGVPSEVVNVRRRH
jgi:hypothetical protein